MSSGRLVVTIRASCLDGAEGDVSILCLSLSASLPQCSDESQRRSSRRTHLSKYIKDGARLRRARPLERKSNLSISSRECVSKVLSSSVYRLCSFLCHLTCAQSVSAANHSAKRSEALFLGMVSGLLVSQDWCGARFPFKNEVDRKSWLRIPLGEMLRLPISI